MGNTEVGVMWPSISTCLHSASNNCPRVQFIKHKILYEPTSKNSYISKTQCA